MAGLTATITQLSSTWGKPILMLLGFILAVGIAYLLYKQFIHPMILTKMKGYDDIANRPKNGHGGSGDSSEIPIYFFHADWCPHCRKCAPEWQKFSDEYTGKTVNGKKLRLIDVNTTEETPENAELSAKFNVSGIPMVVAVVNGEHVALDGKVTYDTLVSFANTLGK
jgi:thiol-disulfide isomerase/thioredoxin